MGRIGTVGSASDLGWRDAIHCGLELVTFPKLNVYIPVCIYVLSHIKKLSRAYECM